MFFSIVSLELVSFSFKPLSFSSIALLHVLLPFLSLLFLMFSSGAASWRLFSILAFDRSIEDDFLNLWLGEETRHSARFPVSKKLVSPLKVLFVRYHSVAIFVNLLEDSSNQFIGHDVLLQIAKTTAEEPQEIFISNIPSPASWPWSVEPVETNFAAMLDEEVRLNYSLITNSSKTKHLSPLRSILKAFLKT